MQDKKENQENFLLSIVVPVFNEENAIEGTCSRLKQFNQTLPQPAELIFVNDGSLDRTAELLAKQSGIVIHTHPFNRGYGAALRTGLDQAKGTWLAIIDCDGTYPIEEIGRLLQEASAPGTKMVVGARKISFSWDQPFHKIARWLLRKMVKHLTGIMVPDLNSGMRIFQKSIYEEFRHLLPFGFSFTTTITVASLFNGYNVKYLPIEYGKRTGKSHIRPVRDFIGFVILITRLASYFDPLKFFVPVSIGIFLIACVRAVRDIFVTNGIGSAAVILVFFSLQAFLIGVIADVVVRRSASFSARRPD